MQRFRFFLMLAGIVFLSGCSPFVEQEALTAPQSSGSGEIKSGTFAQYELAPQRIQAIEESEFRNQYGGKSAIKELKNKTIDCRKGERHFVYHYATGNIKVYTSRPLDRKDDIFRLYRFKMPHEHRLHSYALSGFGTCAIENPDLLKIKEDGKLLDSYPTAGETRAMNKNNIPDVLFEIAQGWYQNVWAYRFGKDFNSLLKQDKAQFFSIGKKEVRPHSQHREFCETSYTTTIPGTNQDSYYEKLIIWSEKDAEHYYLLEYALPTDLPGGYRSVCPPPIFVDIQASQN